MTPVFTEQPTNDWFLPADVREQLTKTFSDLQAPVTLELFTAAGMNDEFNSYTTKFCHDLARLTDAVTLTEHPLDSERAKTLDITASPTLCVSPDQYHIRFLGAPMGEEAKALITAIMLVSLKLHGLSDSSTTLLDTLNDERLAQVFVSPT